MSTSMKYSGERFTSGTVVKLDDVSAQLQCIAPYLNSLHALFHQVLLFKYQFVVVYLFYCNLHELSMC